MGRIARTAAHFKNVTADPVVFAGKFVGHLGATVGHTVKTKTTTAMKAIRVEEANIETRKVLKREQEAKFDALIDDVFAKPSATPKAPNPVPKTTKAKKTHQATA